ncbi:hypothetical protein DFH07DRAFT_786042 [Mycena maculata]|nr:hypothetical protein DFH07DRAFT_786042 [Mycena maculata]
MAVDRTERGHGKAAVAREVEGQLVDLARMVLRRYSKRGWRRIDGGSMSSQNTELVHVQPGMGSRAREARDCRDTMRENPRRSVSRGTGRAGANGEAQNAETELPSAAQRLQPECARSGKQSTHPAPSWEPRRQRCFLEHPKRLKSRARFREHRNRDGDGVIIQLYGLYALRRFGALECSVDNGARMELKSGLTDSTSRRAIDDNCHREPETQIQNWIKFRAKSGRESKSHIQRTKKKMIRVGRYGSASTAAGSCCSTTESSPAADCTSGKLPAISQLIETSKDQSLREGAWSERNGASRSTFCSVGRSKIGAVDDAAVETSAKDSATYKDSRKACANSDAAKRVHRGINEEINAVAPLAGACHGILYAHGRVAQSRRRMGQVNADEHLLDVPRAQAGVGGGTRRRLKPRVASSSSSFGAGAIHYLLPDIATKA